jgi:DNA-binding SARP family transcriptional activator/tetratricopeptide (TPR) repeat protein
MDARRATPESLEIRLLGELEVRRAGRVLALPHSKKTRALIGYLVATRRPHSRDQLCELFWDGPDDPRGALRWSLTKIRSLLGDAESVHLIADRERIAFDPAGAVVDLVAVHQDVGADPATASTEALSRAAGLFRGEFLDGADLPACYRYHEWWVAERESLRGLRTRILSVLVGRLHDQPESALASARTLVQIDPFSEAAHIAVIQLLNALGRTREALQQYESCRRMLEDHVGARPSAALEQARMALGASEPVRLPAVQPRDDTTEPDIPLVGRDAERADIARVVHAAKSGQPSDLLLITGETGIGKTRLLEEVARQVRGAGGIVLTGRAYEAETVRPYGPWIDAIRSISLSRVMSSLRTDLAALLPELGSTSAAPSDRNRLFDAVRQLLSSVGEPDAPTGLLLDDLQWFDEASTALLHFVARALADSRVVIACAARPGELAGNTAALALVRGLRRSGRLRQIPLGPLSPAETKGLVKTVGQNIDADRVFTESEGNPLFALEVSRALTRGDHTISNTLEGLLRDHLGRLDEAARSLVDWAAVLGRKFSLDLLRKVSGIPVSDLLTQVEDLERHGVVRAAGSSATGADCDFTHDLLRQVAYRDVSEPRRRIIHLQIARALAAEDDGEGGLSGDVAHHAALGADPELAARACVAAGERCLRLFAHSEALSLAQRGFPLVAGLPRETRLRLHMALLKLAIHADNTGRRLPDLDIELARVIREAREAGLAAEVATGFDLLSFLHHSVGDFSAALQDTLEGAEAARSADPATAARAFGNTGRCLAQIERDIPRAEALLLEAQTLANSAGVAVKDIPWGLGLVRSHEGRHEEAAQLLEQGLNLARIDHDHWAECECLARLALNDLEWGRPDRARARCVELAPVAAKMGDGSERPFAATLAALVALAAGEADADVPLEHALEDLRRVDAKALLARALTFAGFVAFQSGHTESARQRGREALAAAETVGSATQIATAHALLGSLAFRANDRSIAATHLEAARLYLAAPGTVTARARRSILDLAALLGS